MSDIVQRLAVHAWRSDGWTRADCAEAAAEIERLRHELTIARAERDHAKAERDNAERLVNEARAERDEAVERGNDWCDQAKKARAERDRLREALRQLLTVMPVFPDAAKKIVGMEDRYNAALDAARAALKEAGHE